MQKYQPNYEPLSDMLKRRMSHGLTETEAKLDICRALPDGRIHLQSPGRLSIPPAGRLLLPPAGPS